MKQQALTCKTCGASIQIQSRFSKTITCRYCNTVYLIENNNLNHQGITKPFRPLSIFSTGVSGTYQNQPFQILGRIHLQDDEDEWDEWFITLNQQPYWLEESFDQLSLFSSINPTHEIPSFNQISVGQSMVINNQSIFIVEKGTATVIGTEGEFSGKVKPSQNYQYLQGHLNDHVYSIEYYPDSIQLNQGQLVNYQQFQVDGI